VIGARVTVETDWLRKIKVVQAGWIPVAALEGVAHRPGASQSVLVDGQPVSGATQVHRCAAEHAHCIAEAARLETEAFCRGRQARRRPQCPLRVSAFGHLMAEPFRRLTSLRTPPAGRVPLRG
jgi:hypothetical protein